MKKARFDVQFLEGLYLFLRQIDLSVDRAFGVESWPELAKFFANGPCIDDVRENLMCGGAVDLDEKPSLPLEAPKISRPFFLLPLFRSHASLTCDELIFVYVPLHKFATYLKVGRPSNDELISLRAELCFAEEIIDAKIAAERRTKGKCVTHFNQNLTLNCRSIEEITGRPWP